MRRMAATEPCTTLYSLYMSCDVQVREKDFEHEEEEPPLPLPSVGEIERPQSAVDSASLQLPSDLSVSSLR